MNEKWINVEDRLPNGQVSQLVINSDGSMGVAWHGSNYYWYAQDDWGDPVLEVTHWMPLPEPPESE